MIIEKMFHLCLLDKHFKEIANIMIYPIFLDIILLLFNHKRPLKKIFKKLKNTVVTTIEIDAGLLYNISNLNLEV